MSQILNNTVLFPKFCVTLIFDQHTIWLNGADDEGHPLFGVVKHLLLIRNQGCRNLDNKDLKYTSIYKE